jgi:hypothetical protein
MRNHGTLIHAEPEARRTIGEDKAKLLQLSRDTHENTRLGTKSTSEL